VGAPSVSPVPGSRGRPGAPAPGTDEREAAAQEVRISGAGGQAGSFARGQDTGVGHVRPFRTATVPQGAGTGGMDTARRAPSRMGQ
jgi:hypothetical protein